ncbi:MAG TPA: helix-turn-helix domain-containing protein, partial [Saccharospirillum sp.]|nr:helix-turn-helix domain-containing protein [Saccharospirillum sp.]
MNTADVLQIFGLEPRETRLYLALLQSGPASIRDIADRAGINRGTTHELLKRMQQKGVVSYFPKGKRRHFSAEPPQRLRELALNHQQQ